MWRRADARYGTTLGAIIDKANGTFHRWSGLYSPTQIHAAHVSHRGFGFLLPYLPKAVVAIADGSYLCVCQQVRWHWCPQILKSLVTEQHAPADLRDFLFSIVLRLRISRARVIAPGGQNRPVLGRGVRGLQQSREYVRHIEFNGVGQ